MRRKYRILEFIVITEIVTAIYMGILVTTSVITTVTGIDGLLAVGIVIGISGYPIGKGLGIFIPRLCQRIKMWEMHNNQQKDTMY